MKKPVCANCGKEVKKGIRYKGKVFCCKGDMEMYKNRKKQPAICKYC